MGYIWLFEVHTIVQSLVKQKLCSTFAATASMTVEKAFFLLNLNRQKTLVVSWSVKLQTI